MKVKRITTLANEVTFRVQFTLREWSAITKNKSFQEVAATINQDDPQEHLNLITLAASLLTDETPVLKAHRTPQKGDIVLDTINRIVGTVIAVDEVAATLTMTVANMPNTYQDYDKKTMKNLQIVGIDPTVERYFQ